MASEQKGKDLDAEGLAALKAIEEGEDASIEEALRKLDRAKLIQVLDRGVVNDRLDIKLPADRVGYWIRERQEDIDRMKALGARFESSKTILTGKSLHGSEGDRIRVGDVVLMSLPRQIHDAIMAINKEKKGTLLKRGRKEFLDNRVPGVPHYEEA